MGVTDISYYCKVCNEKISKNTPFCPVCRSKNKLVVLKLEDKLSVSDSLKVKGFDNTIPRGRKHQLVSKRRVEVNGTQQSMDIERRSKNKTIVYHKVQNSDGDTLHNEKKVYVKGKLVHAINKN